MSFFYCNIADIQKTALLSMRAALLTNFEGHNRMLLIQVLVVWDLELFWTVAFQKGCTHEQMAKVLFVTSSLTLRIIIRKNSLIDLMTAA